MYSSCFIPIPGILNVCLSYYTVLYALSRENSHLGRYHCKAGLQFDWVGFSGFTANKLQHIFSFGSNHLYEVSVLFTLSIEYSLTGEEHCMADLLFGWIGE